MDMLKKKHIVDPFTTICAEDNYSINKLNSRYPKDNKGIKCIPLYKC
jgi:hypothetical protein